ncbi:MAG: hypothetical protein OXT65_12895 [Alphaproteobacteria bacterium]|nr:hypothetical protein [Alphaproteobacteria bacterium]
MDTGTRVPLHVYEQEGDFVFIDANGAWYLLNSQEQSLVQLEWSWNKELPAYYLGTFRLRPGDTVPSFVKESVPEKKDVYLFKDPPAQ